MLDLLSPQQASEHLGIPEAQLLRWAYLRVGPKFIGDRHRPQYNVVDLDDWQRERTKATVAAMEHEYPHFGQ